MLEEVYSWVGVAFRVSKAMHYSQFGFSLSLSLCFLHMVGVIYPQLKVLAPMLAWCISFPAMTVGEHCT